VTALAETTPPDTTPRVALAEKAERETGEIMRRRLERIAEQTVNRDGVQDRLEKQQTSMKS
jgi:hypothetical protein